MLSVIQRQATGHFPKATDTTAISPKLTEWFSLDYNNRIDILALDHEITDFAYLSNGCLTVVEGLNISQDLSEARRKVVSGCVGETSNINIFLVPLKILVQDFVSWDFEGKTEKFRWIFSLAPRW